MYLRDRCCVALPPDLDKGIEPCGLCGHDGRGRAAHVACKGKGIPRVRGVGVGVGDGERKRKQVCQRGREERREKTALLAYGLRKPQLPYGPNVGPACMVAYDRCVVCHAQLIHC